MRKIYLTLVFCFYSISAFSDSENIECAKKNSVNVDVNGMVCDFCARGIEKTFYDDALVKRVLVSLETGKVLIAYDNAKKVDFGEIKNIFLSNGQSATGMTLKKIT